MPREYGTDPSGILARGAPGASSRSGGVSINVGGVGRAIPTIYPGVSAGRGLGGTIKIPIVTPAVKKSAKGGAVEAKCDPQVAAFKNMIKDSAKPVKKACGGAAKVRKGMMKGK